VHSRSEPLVNQHILCVIPDGCGHHCYFQKNTKTRVKNYLSFFTRYRFPLILSPWFDPKGRIVVNGYESALNTNFSVTTTTDLTTTPSTGGGTGTGGSGTGTGSVPSCPTNAVVYPNGLGTYVGGTVVTASNGNLYQCISNQVAPWCNSAASAYYAPATGYAWTSAWALYGCKH
jgi:hypothetical protein